MKNQNPLVSVIINCFNGEKFLKEAIDSVYNQSYQNWEIIFWDNNSSDNSSIIAKGYSKKLRYFKSNTTTVLGKARVDAVKKASGDLLAFLDCDDLWLKHKLKTQVSFYNKDDNLDMIYTKAHIINSEGKIIGVTPDKPYVDSGNIFSELVKENFIPFVSAIISKEKYFKSGGFPLHFVNATDYSLFLNISINCKVLGLNEVTCMVRQHNNNLSSTTKVKGANESLEVVKSFLPNLSAKIGLKYQIGNLIISLIKEFNFSQAFFMILRNPNTIWMILRRLVKKLIIKF
jgi:glycosyltransferase involved in cell wall biosynthesis